VQPKRTLLQEVIQRHTLAGPSHNQLHSPTSHDLVIWFQTLCVTILCTELTCDEYRIWTSDNYCELHNLVVNCPTLFNVRHGGEAAHLNDKKQSMDNWLILPPSATALTSNSSCSGNSKAHIKPVKGTTTWSLFTFIAHMAKHDETEWPNCLQLCQHSSEQCVCFS